AFVLKYRLVHVTGTDPGQQMTPLLKDWDKFKAVVAPVVALDIADGKKAIEYVRGRAKELGVQPNRIGIMGFSAGGTVAAHVLDGFLTVGNVQSHHRRHHGLELVPVFK
ncbi:MAG: hypothetical protein EOO62_34395, partial [Hymenobacter sp.]